MIRISVEDVTVRLFNNIDDAKKHINVAYGSLDNTIFLQYQECSGILIKRKNDYIDTDGIFTRHLKEKEMIYIKKNFKAV